MNTADLWLARASIVQPSSLFFIFQTGKKCIISKPFLQKVSFYKYRLETLRSTLCCVGFGVLRSAFLQHEAKETGLLFCATSTEPTDYSTPNDCKYPCEQRNLNAIPRKDLYEINVVPWPNSNQPSCMEISQNFYLQCNESN